MKTKLPLAVSAVLVGFMACGAIIANVVDPPRPRLVLRASRLVALPGQPIMLTAEVTGPDVEAFYCPRVVWELPDGTESSTESDCAPWAPGVQAERRWSQHGALAAPGKYLFAVRLEKPRGHVLARETLELIAAGGQ